MTFNPLEELGKPRGVMRHFEFIEDPAIGQPDGDGMPVAADINLNSSVTRY